MRILVNKALWRKCIEFIVAKHQDDGTSLVLSGNGWTKVDLAGEVNRKHIFDLGIKEAQELIDSLWACGLRPTEGQGSAGAMAATQEHLKDMKELVGKLLPVVLKEKKQ